MGKKPRKKSASHNQREQGKAQAKSNLEDSKSAKVLIDDINIDRTKSNGVLKSPKKKEKGKSNINDLVTYSVKTEAYTDADKLISVLGNNKPTLNDKGVVDNPMNHEDDNCANSKLLDINPKTLRQKETCCARTSAIQNCRTKGKQNKMDGYISNNLSNGNVKTNKDDNEDECESIDKNENADNNSENEENECSDTLFPKHLEWVIFILTLAFRLWYVSNPLNWWVLHPDEIYQTIEVAHSEVYGYGFRAYEYLPPPEAGWENVTSEIRHYEISKGMYSLRSFLLPKILAIVMYAGNIVAPDMSPYLVMKLFHVVVTSSLPLTVFKFSLAVYQSRDSAMLSAILVCSSTTLNVFGTHTLSNSFIAPVLFYTLVPLIKILKLNDIKNSPTSEAAQNNRYYQNGYTVNVDRITTRISESKCISNCQVNGHIDREYLVEYIASLDQNGNSLKHRLRALDQERIGRNGYSKHGKNVYRNGICNGAKEYLESNHKVFENVNINVTAENQQQYDSFSLMILSVNRCRDPFKNYILGLLLSLCVYMRPDCAVLPALCVVVVNPLVLIHIKTFLIKIKCYLFGFLTGTLFGGYIDHVMYGVCFLSPVQWFRFNVWKNGSSDVFGTQSSHFYPTKFLDLEPGTVSTCFIFILDIVITLKACRSKSYSENQNSVHLMVTTFFILYSLLGHKEYRFLHNAIVLLYIAYSKSFLAVIHAIMRLFTNQNRCLKTYLIYMFIIYFTSSHIYNFLTIRDSSLSSWTYGGKVGTSEINICLDFLRKQKDVRGVYIQHEVYMFGGYTVLHKNVSLIARNQGDIVEFSISKRVNSIDPYGKLKSLTLFSRISEFISQENSLYLAKTLINNEQFNYVIVPSSNSFIQVGYRQVFSVRNTSVLQRTFDVEEEETLTKLADIIPIGRNATILEYEGYRLVSFGLYAKAERRLLISNRLDPKRIGPFQLLRKIFHKLGNTDDLSNVIKACVQVHPRVKCNGRYIPFELKY